MSAFSAAVDVLFNDPNMAVDAVYVDQTAQITDVRVIRIAADSEIGALNARIRGRPAVFDIRSSEIERPQKGDRLRIGTEIFEIQGSPDMDAEGLVWTLDTMAVA